MVLPSLLPADSLCLASWVLRVKGQGGSPGRGANPTAGLNEEHWLGQDWSGRGASVDLTGAGQAWGSQLGGLC